MSQPLHRKILERDNVAQTLREARDAGRTVVQCHGCFDIVHPGHLRYLQFARQLGDLLVVSLTGDAAVAKGPDRPYIPQELRAENLAALEIVDWVVIDPSPTACELLEILRPDVYVKGREYAASNDPRFIREREIVESYGGRVVFHSGDVVLSSTRMIESLEGDADLDRCRLRTLCERSSVTLTAVREALEGFAGVRAVVVGDLLRERYVSCDAGQAAEDAPVLSLQKLGTATYWGGAAAVAFQLQALGVDPILITATGQDELSHEFADHCANCGLELVALPQRPQIPERSTFVADDAKLFKLNDGGCLPLDSTWERRATRAVLDRIPDADLLIWCDHGYGMISPNMAPGVTAAARTEDVTIAGHCPGARGGVDVLRNTDLLCLTERRLREAMHDMGSSLPSVTWTLLNKTHGAAAIVSLHKRGLIGFDGRGHNGDSVATNEPARLRSEFVPSLAAYYVDLLGADEAVLATASLALATKRPLPMATYLAAAAEALASNRPGRSRVKLADLYAWLDTRPELRPQSRFMPDAATIGDLARLAPPLPDLERELLRNDISASPILEPAHGEAKEQ